MQYPALIEKCDDGFYIVTFRDVPESATQGRSYEEAIELAQDVLLSGLESYFDRKMVAPMPSKPQKGEVMISITDTAFVKLLVLNTMVETKTTQAELSRGLNLNYMSVQRFSKLKQHTKLDTLADALAYMGKCLSIKVVDIKQ